MASIFSFIYFVVYIVFIIYELVVFNKPYGFIQHIEKMKDKSVPFEEKQLFVGFSLFHAIWLGIGFFTSQWFFVLLLFVLSTFVSYVRGKLPVQYKIPLIKFNALLCLSILLFIIINRYHLHWQPRF